MDIFRRLFPTVTLLFFSLLVVLSLLAGHLGVDPDMKWGPFRQAAFVIGAAGLLGVGGLELVRALDRRALSRSHAPEQAKPENEAQPRASEAIASPLHRWAAPRTIPARQHKARWAVFATALLTGITYVGLVSVWHWTDWPSTTASYAALGEALRHGRTFLPADSVPCDVNAPVYEGKCYLYWGPAPAAALAILMLLGTPPPGDEVVVFIAVSLIGVFSSLIVVRLKDTYFGSLPSWLLVAGVATVATIHPMLWFQNSPDVATAAIASGQAFLLGGMYFIVRALTDAKAGLACYAAAGALWALAMTSRLTTAPQVVVLVSGAAILYLRQPRPLHACRAFSVRSVSLLAPLLLVLALYGAYNLSRFNSPFETGWRYAPYNLARFGSPSETGWRHPFSPLESNSLMTKGPPFSWRYLIPNTFYHFLAPIRPISGFPYVRAHYGEYRPFSPLLPRLGVPAVYGVEDAAGLLFAAPTLVFVLPFARRLITGRTMRPSPTAMSPTRVAGRSLINPDSIGSLLLLSALAGMLPVILNYFSTIRYEMDYVPSMAIVAVLGMWRLYEDTRQFRLQSRLSTTAIILLVTAATMVSFLLAISGAGSRFDDANPRLYLFLVGVLPHW